MILFELNEIIDHYNWDDGFEFPKKVLEYSECDLGGLSGQFEVLL